MAKRWIDHVFDSTLGLQEFCANIKPCDIIIINKIWYTVILYCIKWSKILSLIKTYCFLSICIYECIYIYIIHCIVYTPSHSHQPQWHPHGVPQSSQMEIWKSPKISGSSFFLTRGPFPNPNSSFLGFHRNGSMRGARTSANVRRANHDWRNHHKISSRASIYLIPPTRLIEWRWCKGKEMERIEPRIKHPARTHVIEYKNISCV